MKIRDLMRSDVQTILQDQSLGEARELFRARGARHLVVLDRGGTIVGVLSERDLGPIESDEREHESIESVMSPHPVVIGAEATLPQAAERMRGRSIGCLPVLEGKKLAGVVATSDLLERISSIQPGEMPARRRPAFRRRRRRIPKSD